MTDQHDPTMLAKVRKLLAKAEDPAATTAEAELYTAKATELMAAYGIDQALLALADPRVDLVGDLVLVVERPYAADKAGLLGGIALALGCRAVRRTAYPQGEKEISLHLFGHRSALERVELLFTSLLVQAMHALARTPVPVGDHPAAFRRSWLVGYGGAVSRRLEEAEARAAQGADGRFARHGTSSALVLADRSVQVDRALADAYPRLRAGTSRRLSGGGHLDGWRAGQRADLGGAGLHEGPPPRRVTGLRDRV